jgi:hypothetical protein
MTNTSEYRKYLSDVALEVEDWPSWKREQRNLLWIDRNQTELNNTSSAKMVDYTTEAVRDA